MAMPIKPNEKFACFAYAFYGIAGDMAHEIQLGPRLWAFRRLDLDVSKHWVEWIGSVKMNALRDSNFVMLTTTASAKPGILDQENLDLTKTLDYLLYGILLEGVPDSQQGFSLTGANTDGEIVVRQFSDLREYQPSYDMPTFRLTLDRLKHAVWRMDRVRAVDTGGAAYCARLRRGRKVLFDGSRLPNKDGD